MNRNSLQKLAMIRLKEAEALLATGNYSGAYYLSGYAVECALKACIAKKTKRYDFPDLKSVQGSWTHDLEKLLKMTDLQGLFKQDADSDTDLFVNWNTVKDWSEESRYQIHSKAKAHGLYSAITDNQHGVLKWIKQHW